jgi:small subunit ribosomal protein S6
MSEGSVSMRVYETTFIVNAQTDDATLEREVRAVSEFITQNGGKVLHEDRIGTRRLAYEINHQTHGYYTTVVFEAPTELLPLLDRHFKLGEAYLRHLTVICERDLKELIQPEEETTETTEEQEKTTEPAAEPAEAAATDETPEPAATETEEEAPSEDKPAAVPSEEEKQKPVTPAAEDEYKEEEEL